MLCHKHNTKMTLLFTSYVCDICNPPNSTFFSSKNEEGLYKAYLVTDYLYEECFEDTEKVNFFEHKEAALEAATAYDEKVVTVVSNKPFVFDKIVDGIAFTSKYYLLSKDYDHPDTVKVIPY